MLVSGGKLLSFCLVNAGECRANGRGGVECGFD